MNNTGRLPAKAVVLAIISNFIIGANFPVIKIGYELFKITDSTYMKILFAGVRFFLAGIIMLIFSAAKQKKIPVIKKENMINVILIAIVYTFLQYIFFYIGLANTSGASSSVVNASTAFIAVIFAHFAYKDDKINFGKIIGMITGFAGVLISILADDKLEGFSFSGEGFIIIADICFVVGAMQTKHASQWNTSLDVSAYNMIIGGIMLILASLVGGGDEITVTLEGILVLLYLAATAAISYGFWNELTKQYPIGKISVYNFIMPVAGALLSALFLKENIFRWEYIISLIFVSIGIIAVNYKKEV